MTIDKAIQMLENEKKAGTKNIVLAYWTAELFKCKDDDDWKSMSEYVEDQMDWSRAHEDITAIIEESDETRSR